jgi:hypothetical protein
MKLPAMNPWVRLGVLKPDVLEIDMAIRSRALGVCATAVLLALAPAAQAQNFFWSLFGGFARPPQAPAPPPPFAGEGNANFGEGEFLPHQRPSYSYSGGLQAYCVRSCDGRYFPITSSGNQTKAAVCSSFCPAAETSVVYGSSIDNALTESGKPYSELPNAYRYRDELVAGCTCNGKNPAGLASIRIEDDPTIRKGDIVASSSGLMVAQRGADRRGASLSLSPAPQSIRSHFRRPPIVARQ